MASAFSSMVRQMRDRNFGGTSGTQVAEPYISGYFFTQWYLPSTINDYLSKGNPRWSEQSPNSDYTLAGQILSATCLSITPPGGTLNKAEFTGLGGTKWAVPTNIDYGNSLTAKFVEMSGLPIMQIIGGWAKMIRDNKMGVSHLQGHSGYVKSNYAATVFYWTTKPDGITPEYTACYSGVFPTKDPQDLFPGDLSSVDKLEMDIDFNVDFVWHEDWVYDKCVQLSEMTRPGHEASYTTGLRGGDGGSQYQENRGATAASV